MREKIDNYILVHPCLLGLAIVGISLSSGIGGCAGAIIIAKKRMY